MKDIFSLEIFEAPSIDDVMNTPEYHAFDEATHELLEIHSNDLVLTEALVNNKGSFVKRVRKGADTTAKVASSTVKVGVATAKVGGAVLKTEWTIFARCWRLCSKVLNFIAKGLEKIPKAINKSMDALEKIPKVALAKIRGDITVHIQANDVQEFYSKGIIGNIKKYMAKFDAISRGTHWNNIFHVFQLSSRHMPVNTGGNPLNTAMSAVGSIVLGQDDFKQIRDLNKLADVIDNIQLNPSTINMGNATLIELYFSNTKGIKFVDLHGTRHNVSYLEALNFIINDLNDCKKEIEDLQTKFGIKLDASTANMAFANLSRKDQDAVQGVIVQSSAVMGKIGSIVNAVVKDVKEINNNAAKMIEKLNAAKSGSS